jgi:hypothetical protein
MKEFFGVNPVFVLTQHPVVVTTINMSCKSGSQTNIASNQFTKDRWFPSQRRLVLVDIENIAGGATRSAGQAIWATAVVREALKLDDADHVVVGISHSSLLEAGLAWPGIRLAVRSGPDGADRALLRVIDDENVSSRFNEVVIVSGDGIFSDAVASLGKNGVAVTVMAWSQACSRKLLVAASSVYYLDDQRMQNQLEVAA